MSGSQNNSKKSVTLESLSEQMEQGFGIVKKGFDAVDKRFDGVEKRLDGIANRLQEVELGQEDIKLRLDRAAWKLIYCHYPTPDFSSAGLIG